MTAHDTYLRLAAVALDFPLAPSDRGRLEAHLAACPACARRASAYRGDALALGHLPAVVLPERRGAEILASALHPAAVRNPVRLLVLAALLGLLLLGSLAVGAQLLRTTTTTSRSCSRCPARVPCRRRARAPGRRRARSCPRALWPGSS